MILFCGIPSEDPIRLAAEAADARGVSYLLLNQRASQHCTIRLGVSDCGLEGEISVGDAHYPLGEIRGIYTRMIDSAVLPENRPGRGRLPDPTAVSRSRVFHDGVAQFLEVAEGRVLNRPGAMASNMSKPYQCQVIRRHGFEIPPTLVTNDPAEVLEFSATHRRVIFKSTSAIRSIVREFDSRDKRGLGRLRQLPTQFQAYIPGTNFRVHVVGARIFPTEIVTDATDYRYAGREGHPVTMRTGVLPDEVAVRCLALSATLDLPFCGIDLKRTPEGVYYCFEVNPSPAYSYYEERTGQRIAEAVVDYLTGS